MTLQNVNKQYNENGFGSGASGYLIIIFAIACMIGMLYYIRKKEKESQEDKKVDREYHQGLMNRMMDSFIQTNEKITEEIKVISNRHDRLIESFNNSIEGLYSVIGVQTKEIKKEINSEKELSLKEFERQYKALAENCIFKIKDSLENRIEQNMLYENKASICGIAEGCTFENSEMYSLIKKFQSETREKVKQLHFNGDKIKDKLTKMTDLMAKQYAQELCYLFDVEQGYVKSALHRGVRNLSFKVLNKINDINFEELM